MAYPHRVGRFMEYTVPQRLIEKAPCGTVYRHFAWFDCSSMHWIGEWAGYVPAPAIPKSLVGEDRLTAMNAWQQYVQSLIFTGEAEAIDTKSDLHAWDLCKQEDAVCLDVTQFDWPVGDFCYCTFDPVDRRLEWGPPRYYLEILLQDPDTIRVVANQESHRPIRDAVPGQHVIDITGTWLEPYHGQIFGTFVRHDGRWWFEPLTDSYIVPVATQRALTTAPIDLDLIPIQEPALISVDA